MLYRLAWDGCAVALRCDDRRLVDAVENYLDLAAEAIDDDPAATPAADVARNGEGHRVRLAYGETATASPSETVYLVLEAVAYGFAMATRQLVVHAGGFVAAGGAVVCLGAPKAGKSSLSFAAWRRGFDVLGDDRICLDPAAGRASVYPKCLKIRLDGGAPPADMGDLVKQGNAFVGALGDDRRLVLSRRLPGFAGYDAAPPLRALVCIERSDEAASRLEPVPVVEALDDILGHAMLGDRTPMALVRLVKAHAPGGRLPRLKIAPDDTDAALDLLREL
ncbi:MAG: hypothetical protein V3R88_11715 [Alphaproteobacteria bacterium]